MDAHRLRAPFQHGGVLAEPPLGAIPAQLAENQRHFAGWSYDFQGRSTERLRTLARRQVLDAARAYHRHFGLDPVPDLDLGAPLLATGHQPELFHPGVWAKNFAIAGLARRAGLGLNLIVDNDVPHSPTIRVPVVNRAGARVVNVEFDRWRGDVPYEEWAVRDEHTFATFPDRVREALAGQVPDPVLDEFWPLVREAARATDRIGARFAVARRRLEATWGVQNAEIPLSAVCGTEAFLWFASHLLAALPRFQAVHNTALAEYRELYGIRSTHHPVPELAAQGEWREAPFWVWRADSPRRRPLLARQLATTMELRASGEDEPFLTLPLAPDREACCAVEALAGLPARGIRLRTRALTTTLFARLLLSDLFMHGIGGAKYDELGDAIIRGFFGIEPPVYSTLSMTLWVGLDESPATVERLREVERLRREAVYNPERLLANPLPPDLAAALEAKRAAIAGPTQTRPQRVARYHAIRQQNAILSAPLEGLRAELDGQRAALAEGRARNAIAHGRDYAFVIHSSTRLKAALTPLAAGRSRN
jgi:hypothetical protein